ncbi:MAG: phage holin family protein [Eubacterium sp.]|nr:phage holin family protein [Eubacterium sp.]
MFDIFKTIHFASLTWLLILPMAMMAIDILTGLINAWKQKDFQSALMRSGLAKKAGEILILVVGILFTYGMGLPSYILKLISLYIILMELMSVIENLDKLGAPLPKFVKDVINNVGTSVQNDDYQSLVRELKRLELALAQADAAESKKPPSGYLDDDDRK